MKKVNNGFIYGLIAGVIWMYLVDITTQNTVLGAVGLVLITAVSTVADYLKNHRKKG